MTEPEKPPIERVSDLFAVPGALPTRITAPLRRTAPEKWSERVSELLPVLVRASLPIEKLDATRWAVLVHMVAVLSGTTHDRAHAAGRRTGAAIFEAGYSEGRLSKLLTARGEGLRDQVSRLARFLRAKGAQPLDLRPLAQLVLTEGKDERAAEAARLDIARSYYARADRATMETSE